MSTLWAYFWPLFAAGLAIGAFDRWWLSRPGRKHRPLVTRVLAVVVALAAAGLWHGPLGGAARLESTIERTARLNLAYYAMPQVRAELQRTPLTRHVRLSGTADDFQRSALVRVMDGIPGVASAGWRSGGGWAIPLLLEGALAALAGLVAGMLVAIGVLTRRRRSAEWRW